MQNDGFFDNPIVQIVLIIAIAYVVHHVAGWLVKALTRRVRPLKHETPTDLVKRQDTLQTVFLAVARGVVWLGAVIAIMRVFNFDIASVATGAGFLGIVVGLGAQATIRDYVAGFFILAENQYRVGDVISLGGGNLAETAWGTVEEVSLRITKIRDLDGSLHTVRNGEAALITNWTIDYSSVVIDVGVGYESDIDEVEKVINKVGLDMKDDAVFGKDINKPIEFLRVNSFADSAIMIKAIGTVTPAQQWRVAGEYRRRLIVAFRKAHIDIPVPQIVVHNQEPPKS